MATPAEKARRPPEAAESAARRICVVGSGPRFLSGISYYTNRLVRALGARHEMSVVLMRQLLPTRLYPAASRVGTRLVTFGYPAGTRVYDGVNWWWGRSLLRAVGLIWRARPEVVVLQWWTGTVLHTYLALALVARLRGARVVMEFHEVLDTGELGIAPARWYVERVAPLLVRMTDGCVVHTEFDRRAVHEAFGIGERPVAVIPHGPYDQYGAFDAATAAPTVRADVCRLLYFGVIRPFKGVEDLIAAFDGLSPEEAQRFELTVVGETWEGWDVPAEAIAASPYRDRITFVNHYVADDEVSGYFAAADAVVLPYHRSSASGPLHLAMAHGLLAVVTAVGGLVEAAEGYEGAIPVPPQDPEAIRDALREVYGRRGERYADVHSWERTLARYDDLFEAVAPARSRA